MFERDESWQKYGGQGVLVRCPGCGDWLHREASEVGERGKLLELVRCGERRYAVRLVGYSDG